METNPSRQETRGAMEGIHDRISELPDPILGHILSLMPIKPATKTSILSNRWRDLWKLIWVSATTLDFTGDFASGQTPEQLVASIDRYLRLHTSNKIRRFRLALHPANQHRARLQRWVEFVASKCVQELHLDFSPPEEEIYSSEADDEENRFEIPGHLFSSGSLTHLNLSCCNFCLPLDFGGFPLLKSLSLRRANVDDGMLRGILSNCLLLETLSLRECQSLSSIEITSPRTKLKRLVLVDCWEVYNLNISAPSVESFHFVGEINTDFSLEFSRVLDAFVCSIDRESTEPEHDYVKLLSDLAHVRILTICTATLLRVATWEDFYVEEDYFPLRLENLLELQLLMDLLNAEYLSFIYGFFRLCPSPLLEKLFIRLPKTPEDPNLSSNSQPQGGPETVSFEHLEAIKVSNFNGSQCEMELVKFLLGKAANLESLILAAPASKRMEKMDAEALYRRLELLPKASPAVQMVIAGYLEDDSGLNPTHTTLYAELDCWF